MYKAKQRPQPFLYKISCIYMYITFFSISYFKDKTLYTFLTVKAQLEHEHENDKCKTLSTTILL